MSFDERVTQEVRSCVQNVKTVQLYNFYDDIPLPERNKWIENDTISISAFNVTKEVVDFCHEHGTKVAVWIDTETAYIVENDEHYLKMMGLQVDYIITDFPLKARQFVVEHKDDHVAFSDHDVAERVPTQSSSEGGRAENEAEEVNSVESFSKETYYK